MFNLKTRTLVLFFFIILCKCSLGQYIPFCQKGKWGFATTKGTIVIPCKYEEVGFYSDDDLVLAKKSGKYGYINKAGIAVIPFQYDECFRIYEIHHGEYSMGFITNPKIHLNNNFDFNDIPNNRYIVSKRNKYGIIKLSGDKVNELVPVNYSTIQFDPARKIFYCHNTQNLEYFNMNGQSVTPEQLNKIEEIKYETVAQGPPRKAEMIIINGKSGVVLKDWYNARKYDTIVPAIYDEILPNYFKYDYSPAYDIFGVRLGKKWGFLNGSGKIILPIVYDSINFNLSSKRHWLTYQYIFVVQQKKKWGILSKKEEQENSLITNLPFEFESISNLCSKYIIVEKSGGKQVYDTEKYIFISNKKYASITRFEHESIRGFCLFQIKNKQGQTVYLGENGVEFYTDQ